MYHEVYCRDCSYYRQRDDPAEALYCRSVHLMDTSHDVQIESIS